jgi:hypothetical protein
MPPFFVYNSFISYIPTIRTISPPIVEASTVKCFLSCGHTKGTPMGYCQESNQSSKVLTVLLRCSTRNYVSSFSNNKSSIIKTLNHLDYWKSEKKIFK